MGEALGVALGVAPGAVVALGRAGVTGEVAAAGLDGEQAKSQADPIRSRQKSAKMCWREQEDADISKRLSLYIDG